ncbi:MAG: bifunctional phosphoserine phosphatase/homoserine phosphotransferase ThrH [Gammaproteobacteria bacterium]|nr:bifunctional phosphoserine phosphatase/homoserine phosphotransferase ThrH [Gammaproteobacteria bacterium]
MEILCLDLEGVLIPEIWQAVAERTQIEELLKTTRDIPDYDELMQSRMRLSAEHDLSMSLIEEVIGTMDPLPGAEDFLTWARSRFQIAIISDTFYQFAMPLVAKLGGPLLLCHRLEVKNDRIVGYRLRQPDPKRMSVRSFKSLNYRVLAAGDSYNDVSMLQEADEGFFYQAPANVKADFPQFPAADDYAALQRLLEAARKRLQATI